MYRTLEWSHGPPRAHPAFSWLWLRSGWAACWLLLLRAGRRGRTPGRCAVAPRAGS